MLNGLTILVTGGTGSFGRKFTETVLERHDPRKLIVFSRDELKQEVMRHELRSHPKYDRVRFFLGDIRDRDRLYRAFTNVDIVVHAAALKQVPACEYNPFEAVQTNVHGARNIIDAAVDREVKKVIVLSTDKAVNPVNLYGATKLCAEKLTIQGNAYAAPHGTKLSCARYGNVVGSRGSVIPLFLDQRKTGTLTLTDPRMTRFWITLKQGVDFVIHCIDVMHGREIFVPKIPSMRVIDLARIIGPECEMREVGIRPGEKLHEVLVSVDEARHALELDDMFIIEPWGPYFDPGGWPGSRTLLDGFTYTSDNNPDWLNDEQLKTLIGETESNRP